MKFSSRMSFLRVAGAVVSVQAASGLLSAAPAVAQSISSPFADVFSLSQFGSGVGGVTQMTFAPGVSEHLYIATFGDGVWRYDYSPTGNLMNGRKVVDATTASAGGVEGSLGIAFHQDSMLGTVMYLAPAVPFMGGGGYDDLTMQTIVRLTDAGGNGVFGDEPGDVNQIIVNHLEVSLQHQVNQMQVIGDALYVGVGTRTSNGGVVDPLNGGDQTDPGETAYTGAVNFIGDLTLLSGDTTTTNLAGFTIANHKTDTQTLTSTDDSKLRVFSTGFRNNYGLAVDENDELWVSMNQQGPNAAGEPNRPDELHRTSYRDDHSFAKGNDQISDWKTNADALSAGYFQKALVPVATLGPNASANGFDFLPMDDVPIELQGSVLIARRQPNDVWIVDPVTGATQVFASGFNRPLDVLRDPFGNMLVAEGAFGGGRLFRITSDFVSDLIGDYDNNGQLNSLDWSFFRTHWGDVAADLNGDMTTNELDFTLFKQSYIEVNGEAAFRALAKTGVPEPSSMALSGLAIASFVAWRRRKGE